jgi:exopolysaccharide biosynthesis protein
MNCLCATLLILLTGVLAQAEWKISERRDLEDSSGKVHASELLLTDGLDEAKMLVLYFSPDSIRFRVVPNLEGSMGGVRNAVERAGGIAGTNGGYFDADLGPLGLLISDGRIIHPAQKAKLLSGVFLIKQGSPEIIRARELQKLDGIDQAIQCGPFLVERGRPVAGLDSEKVAARTFIFSCGQACCGLGICRSVSLAALGEIIAESKLVRDHSITKALNLDGGSSTAMYAKLGQDELSSEGRSEVSNYLIIKNAPSSKKP